MVRAGDASSCGARCYPQVAAHGPSDWLVFTAWFAGWLLLLAAACWTAFFSHRVELRADRGAVELLGGTGPVLAMLDRMEAVRSGYGAMQRLQASLTHPDPFRRRRAVAACAVGSDRHLLGATESANRSVDVRRRG